MTDSYLNELASLLAGDAPASGNGARTFVGRGSPAGEVYTVVPSMASPRLLVPHGDRHAAASAIRHTIAPSSAKDRLRQRVLAGVFATGVGSRTVGDLIFRDRVAVNAAGTLAEHLSEVVGVPVRLSLRFGPPRANRKPVLQLIDRSGHTVAFAKLGVNKLTSALVRAEHAALTAIAGSELGPTRIPTVKHFGSWAGVDVLVIEALPVWRRADTDAGRRAAARTESMRSIATGHGVHTRPLAGSAYLDQLADRVTGLGDRPAVPLLRQVLRECAAYEQPLLFGSWHGDWNGGNMSIHGGEVLLWDFERYARDVPVGFDPLHYELHEAVTVRQSDAAPATAALAARCAQLLAPFGVADPATADVVTALYFVEIATRYLGDGQDGYRIRLGRVDEWLDAAFGGLGVSTSKRWAHIGETGHDAY